MPGKTVLVGCAAGGATDTPYGLKQLLAVPNLGYVTLDFMSENMFAPMTARSASQPTGGFASEFLDEHIAPTLAAVKERGVKVITNAGGANPRALAAAIEQMARRQGVSVAVAAVDGADVPEAALERARLDVREMFTGAKLPAQLLSATAYLGARPIAATLAQGADIVITCRVADSALALGALIFEFGWSEDDYERLAAGTTAGHLIECGAQVTGGTFTDWKEVPCWEEPAYPVAECEQDGTFILTKPPGTGGLVTVGTASEQLLYEVDNPRRYVVPDVVCDFSAVQLEQVAPDRVRVTGAKGYPPTESYKVCATYREGWRSVALTPIIGMDAVEKAERRADALFKRSRRILRDHGLKDWNLTYHEVIGAEASYGKRSLARSCREVISKLVVEHDEKRAVELFFREERASQLNLSVGTASGIGPFFAAPKVQEVTRLFSFLLPKDAVPIQLVINGVVTDVAVTVPAGAGLPDAPTDAEASPVDPGSLDRVVPLVDLAWARSGDKGRLFNVAVIAREPEYLPYIRATLTREAVGEWYEHLFEDPNRRHVDRFEVPGVSALNFVVHESLAGGVANGSPRLDRSAKGMAQQLLEHPIRVPAAIAERAAGGKG